MRVHADLDLINQVTFVFFFKQEKLDQSYFAIARVGGIHANSGYSADFVYDKLMVQNNAIHQAFIHVVNNLLFLVWSCIRPKRGSQPVSEDAP